MHAPDASTKADHPLTTTQLGILSAPREATRYAESLPLARSTPLLEIAKYLPNNPQFGDLNRMVFPALQGVESGRLTAAEAAAFVIDEATANLDDVIVE